MDDEPVGDDLYALALSDFISARNERAKAARASGDPERAEQLRALRKPTVAAWLANQVARQHPEEIDALLDLGQRLRAAMASPNGPELRRLNAEQRELVRSLLGHARHLAEASGHAMTSQTEQALAETFHAALAAPSAGQALAVGRLAEAPPADTFAEASAAPGESTAPDRTAEQPVGGRARPSQEEIRLATQRVEAAQALVEAARQTHGRRSDLLEQARTRSESAADLVARLSAELDDATTARALARRAEDEARTEQARAARALREAQGGLEEAQRSLEQVEER